MARGDNPELDWIGSSPWDPHRGEDRHRDQGQVQNGHGQGRLARDPIVRPEERGNGELKFWARAVQEFREEVESAGQGGVGVEGALLKPENRSVMDVDEKPVGRGDVESGSPAGDVGVRSEDRSMVDVDTKPVGREMAGSGGQTGSVYDRGQLGAVNLKDRSGEVESCGQVGEVHMEDRSVIIDEKPVVDEKPVLDGQIDDDHALNRIRNQEQDQTDGVVSGYSSKVKVGPSDSNVDIIGIEVGGTEEREKDREIETGDIGDLGRDEAEIEVDGQEEWDKEGRSEQARSISAIRKKGEIEVGGRQEQETEGGSKQA